MTPSHLPDAAFACMTPSLHACASDALQGHIYANAQ
jgi:hypothetical protein